MLISSKQATKEDVGAQIQDDCSILNAAAALELSSGYVLQSSLLTSLSFQNTIIFWHSQAVNIYNTNSLSLEGKNFTTPRNRPGRCGEGWLKLCKILYKEGRESQCENMSVWSGCFDCLLVIRKYRQCPDGRNYFSSSPQYFEPVHSPQKDKSSLQVSRMIKKGWGKGHLFFFFIIFPLRPSFQSNSLHCCGQLNHLQEQADTSVYLICNC